MDQFACDLKPITGNVIPPKTFVSHTAENMSWAFNIERFPAGRGASENPRKPNFSHNPTQPNRSINASRQCIYVPRKNAKRKQMQEAKCQTHSFLYQFKQ